MPAVAAKLVPCLFQCGAHTQSPQRWCNSCVRETECLVRDWGDDDGLWLGRGATEPTPAARTRHDALLATIPPSVVGAGILPVSAHGDGIWMCCMQHKGGYAYADYGGKRATDDATLWATAVREAREEGGWDFSQHTLRDASQIVPLSNANGCRYVVFVVETIASPLKTRDAAVAHHALVDDAIFRETLHDRLKYATGFRGVLARLLRTPPAERAFHSTPP